MVLQVIDHKDYYIDSKIVRISNKLKQKLHIFHFHTETTNPLKTNRHNQSNKNVKNNHLNYRHLKIK